MLFTGTQNPFNYTNDGERIYSREEELQYGNGICGVDSIELKIDLIRDRSNDKEPLRDVAGNIIAEETLEDVVDSSSGEIIGKTIKVTPETRTVERLFLKPTVKFIKAANATDDSDLSQKVHGNCTKIPKGEILVILSHKNLDNIAKYHILNASSNLYFGGSLPKNGKNQFKFSYFKFSRTVKLVKNGTKWMSEEDNGETLSFAIGNVMSANDDELPPYYVQNGDDVWFLEQDDLPDAEPKKTLPKGTIKGIPEHPYPNCDAHMSYREGTNEYPKPSASRGQFIYAHLVKSKPEKYLDYLYVKNGWLQFKISEESNSFGEAMSEIPPFYVDEYTKNKLQDLNDVQIMQDCSTFIHQSENPDKVKNCSNFNPLFVDAILKYGIEQTSDDSDDGEPTIICANVAGDKAIQLDNRSEPERFALQLEDGEIDDLLKIYTNYVRIDDRYGDFHYDLYFNVQNLFNSPFEYISSITKQPNVLIIPDSYLYLSGDKFADKGDHNEID